MSKKAALYLRVSTASQTTENQRLELEAYCKRMDWTIAKVYEDSGLSGKNDDRPALQEMLADSLKGKFSVVACYKIDRLARSTLDLLNILQRLHSAGVDFVSSSQAIDTTNSAGRMLMTFLGAIAQFERETIVDRVKSGMQRAKAEGIRIGRPRVAFDVARATELKKQGHSWAEIAKQVQTSVATVRRSLYPLLKTLPEKAA